MSERFAHQPPPVDFAIADECYADPTGRTTIRYRTLAAAGCLGRLRRTIRPDIDSYLEYVLDELAGHLKTIVDLVQPTAAEIAAAWAPGDDETVAAAIRLVDERHEQLQRLLGYREVA